MRPVGSGKKAGDIMSWQKQMLLFIFRITPWNREEVRILFFYFHSEPRTGNKKVKKKKPRKP